MDEDNLEELFENFRHKYLRYLDYDEQKDLNRLKIWIMPMNYHHIEIYKPEDPNSETYYVNLKTHDVIILFQNIFGY